MGAELGKQAVWKLPPGHTLLMGQLMGSHRHPWQHADAQAQLQIIPYGRASKSVMVVVPVAWPAMRMTARAMHVAVRQHGGGRNGCHAR
jgi:hypothetical protein